MGMGGAYTGIANDPSSTYYNPAGITTGGRFQLMGSLSSLVFTKRTIDNAFESPLNGTDFTSSRTTTLPHFVGTTVRLGRQRFGEQQFAVAYSTFEIARENFAAGSSTLESAGSVDLRLSNTFRSRWYGVSFAARVKKDVSLGLSAFLAQQNSNYSEDLGLATGGTLNEAGVRMGGDSVTSSSELSTSGYFFVFRLGALYRINPHWQIGFMFQPPGAPLSQKGNVFQRSTSTISGMESKYFLLDQSDQATKLPIPFELRAGVEFRVDTLTVLSLDASITGPVRDRAIFERPDELAGTPRRLGVYFANSTERRWTPNVAIGAEHMFGKAVVAGGLFSNISSAPDVPATATEYTPEQVNMFGSSVSVGVDTKGYRLTLGVNYYFGRGDALAFKVDRSAQVVEYVRTKSTVSALALYVAGAVSVASKGAKEVGDKYKERKERKKSGYPEEGEDAEPSSEERARETPPEEEPEAEPEESPAEPPQSPESIE